MPSPGGVGAARLAGAARAFGALKEIVAGTAPAPTQGVTVAVGEQQASIDLDLVVE